MIPGLLLLIEKNKSTPTPECFVEYQNCLLSSKVNYFKSRFKPKFRKFTIPKIVLIKVILLYFSVLIE